MELRTVRINFFIVTVLLICLGVIMIYSSSSIYAWEKYDDSFFFLKRHLSFLITGILLAFLAMTYNYKKIAKISRPLLIASFILLILVLIPGIGKEVSGARRWFRYKIFSFQPSELATMAVIIYLADFISRKENMIKDFFRGFLPPLLVLGMAACLILMQPDLGTALALGIVVFIMLFISGVKLQYLISLIVASIPALFFLIFAVPYRRMRIMAFLNPWMDPKGSGFQIIQSQIALGSGGLLGTGLGHSRQKLFYLPAAHTDFIFSIIGEELGLVGTLGLILLFMTFILLGIKIIKNAPDRFGYFLGLGLLLSIIFKVAVNIGVSCGLLPTKGLPLPFISYGGSSFIFDMISAGILLNICSSGENP